MTTTNDRQQQLNKFIALKKQQATKAKQDVVSKAAKEIVKAELAAVNKKYEMSFDEEECLIVKNNKTKEVVKNLALSIYVSLVKDDHKIRLQD
ncbi:hypothetical protein [Salinivibrio costicola]|uniref:hypothetical protein n=1 Tax=Salinivibrio costicola TaxID=51367 RepID=UPI00046FAE3D|nr:hypothetical protein [Salinivibrio costicola]